MFDVRQHIKDPSYVWYIVKGVCTLLWVGCMHSKVAHFRQMLHSLKCSILYGNVKMTIYFDIISLMKNYMVVNELKNPYEE
jgi:hypothetical protein